MSLAQAVKGEANRLGFRWAGITTPDPPPHFGVFERWLAAGRQGEMAYLATERSRQRRADPRQILPGCRSILVLGVPYIPPDFEPEDSTEPTGGGSQSPSPQGRVAAYAWGEDYHDVLPRRLQALVGFIEGQVGHPVPNRWYTDTGPVLERDLAQRAGLGWIGKNGCLIDPKTGSYFLLAEILLGIDLEPDPPFTTDHCGSCTRCLEACPTQCILPDRTLDAPRCISYLTIELKGAIPPELRPQLGDWVFGCDVCQQVCPWNQRFAARQDDEDRERRPPGEQSPAALILPPRPQIPRPDLVKELSLTPETFNRKFKGSPVKRAKRRGYLRNVAVALGNLSAGSADPAAVQALSAALKDDPEPVVRAHAAWALGQTGGENARQALCEAQDYETDENVLPEIQAALDRFQASS